MSKKFTTAYQQTEDIFKTIEETPGYAERAAEFERNYEIAMALHQAREKSKLSQRELAELLHTTQSAISRMESGRANITIAKLQEYAAACGGKLEVKIAF